MDVSAGLPHASVANLHFVTPALAIGGDLDAYDPHLAGRQLDEIAALGITRIVDCRLEWDDAELVAERQPQIAYLHHGMDDAGQRVPAAWFDEALRFVTSGGRDAVVLAHCHMGINRGPSLGFALLLAQGWDPIGAISAIRTARPVANVWYAEDALRWHHGRRGTNPREDLKRLAAWRKKNPLDVVRIIRGVREAEGRK
ncbi:protein-tyrosine phosphatase [Motilibacter rhizosphaerae]|uniref:Protein-tyrosine phosphatase n=1 Tax=Motilibacter rhizosphaerae TaxID=598652 RepID=A0A4Q7NP69_9ACTN|nr:dual specificity protein phosphatase [Motilibacter rhizosphaerae]RZS86882.1 protein-tyrosine phosphatase [Motilibacter rhizosphaerae]